MDLVIRNGMIVTGYDMYKADIAIKDGKIIQISSSIPEAGVKEIDAEGKYVMPGFIDPHVHLHLPMRGTYSSDDFETGTKAAAAGGVTTILDFATQTGNELLEEAIYERKKEAYGNAYVDYGFHGGITNWSAVKPELEDIINQGISSFKMFMAYKKRDLFSSDADILDALAATRQLGGMILVHAEVGDVIDQLIEQHYLPEYVKKYGIKLHSMTRPPITEYAAIQRAISLAEYVKGNLYVVHMSTGKGADMVARGRSEGINVIGETCPQYLLFDESVFEQNNGHYFATAPQIKSIEDKEKLWANLLYGGLQVIGTDSCTFTKEQKDSWNGDFTKIPLGLPGTELMGSLLFSEGVIKRSMSLNRFVRLLSTNAAKVFGMYPKKGSLQVGSDADIVLFDPQAENIVDHITMETNCDWNPYDGKKIIGLPWKTLLRGEIVAENGKCIGSKGFGEYVPRGTSGNFLAT